jgi:3-oxoacyl-[acyl-carrier-protein] synthase III
VIGSLATRVSITGVGGHVPERVLANDELAAMVDTSEEWIYQRTGIRERRLAAEGETCADLAEAAARAALRHAGVEAASLDLLVVATATPDLVFPATAALVQERIGASGAASYDLACACTGFVYAMAQAVLQLHLGFGRRALIVGAETLSRLVDWDDRGTAVLFGDGAGAVVLEADAVEVPALFSVDLGAEGSAGAELLVPMPGWTPKADGRVIRMNGREVYRFASRFVVESVQRLAQAAEVALDEIDWIVFHQANQRILEHIAEKLGLPPERVLSNLDRYGNTSAASIPLVLAEAVQQGKLTPGQRVLLVGYGAGLAWGSCLLSWGNATNVEGR